MKKIEIYLNRIEKIIKFIGVIKKQNFINFNLN